MNDRPLRLFVALYPPKVARRAMLEALLNQPPRDKFRAVPVEQVHMTVQFVGETRERDLDDVIESVRRAASGLGTFSLTPAGLITLPEQGDPRLIAMETDAPAALLEAHRRLAMRLARSPRARSADRFCPHLTLCRFAGEAKGERIARGVELDRFEVRSLRLMRSILRPQGAEHVVIDEVPLG